MKTKKNSNIIKKDQENRLKLKCSPNKTQKSYTILTMIRARNLFLSIFPITVKLMGNY